MSWKTLELAKSQPEQMRDALTEDAPEMLSHGLAALLKVIDKHNSMADADFNKDDCINEIMNHYLNLLDAWAAMQDLV